MSVAGWLIAACSAGLLGWIGRPAIALLPESPNAWPDSPTYRAISRAPNLGAWLAASAIGLVTIVSLAVPNHLLPAWIIVCGVGTWLAYVDWRTNLLPTRIVWPLYIATLVVVALEAWLAADVGILIRAAVTSMCAFTVFWVLWWIGELWRPGAFGYGDVRLSAPLGLVLGSVGGWAAPTGLYLGFVIGAVIGLAIRARGHQGEFAFGPAMVAGAVLGVVLAS